MSSADRGIVAQELHPVVQFPQKPKKQWITPRSVFILGTGVIALHLLQESVLGTSATGSFLANTLQIFCAALAVLSCLAAIGRGTGFTRPFWLLIALSFVVWIAADLGWMYYESYLQVPPPRDSSCHFLMDCRWFFLAIALLLDQNEDSPPYYFELASLLDTLQLFIIFVLIYVGWYQVPSLHESRTLSMLRSDQIELTENLAVLTLAVLQVIRARNPELRRLYWGFLICFVPLTVGICITDYRELRLSREVPTGTWLDLWWTAPFLFAAWWAAGWEHTSDLFNTRRTEQRFVGMLFENTIYAVGPLIVLLQVAHLGPEWRDISFSLLGLSILGFGVRLALSKSREADAMRQIRRTSLALVESEARFRTLLEDAPLAVRISRDAKILWVNRAYLNSFRYSDVSEVVGLPIGAMVSPECRAEVEERANLRSMGKAVSNSYETTALRKDGSRFDAQFDVTRVKLPDGPATLAFLSDITERMRAERALRESEDRYRDLVEHSEDLVCTHDLQGNLLSANPAPARLLGYEVTELLNIPMRNLVAPEFRDYFDAYLERIRVSGSEKGLLCVLTKSGERRIWEFSNTLRTEGVCCPVVRGMAHDITERKRTEAALRGSERRYRTLFEKTVAGVGILSLDGLVIDCNDAWARMFGHDNASHCRGQQISNCYHHPSQREILLAELKKTGTFLNREWELQGKDGRPFWVLLNSVLLSDGENEPLIQSTISDITERKQAEEALRRSDERFRVALKDSPITVFNQDHDLRYTWIYNPQLCWQHDVLGKTDEEILGKKKAAGLTALKSRVLQSGTAIREEVAIPVNGHSYAFDMTVEPLFDKERAIVGITGACMDIARLRERLDRLQEARDQMAREKAYLETQIQAELGFEDVIGQSPALREVLKKAQVVAPTDSTVLLLGETGTGKELIARSLHALSTRRERTFVKLNCAAVPSGLPESELFGHEKGAFTGAVSQKIGRIELADQGTLFLDEIGEMPLELQPKLLRVLQDREFERLGGVKTLRVDVRIISATNRDLQQDIAEKKFREDLYYRLNVFPIEMPALRERKEDIPMLVRHFVGKHAARMGKHIDMVPDEVMRILKSWNWPGNIRELENMIERMVILSTGRVLAAPPSELMEASPAADDHLTEMEREHIIRVLRETNGVLSGTDGAAVRLGLKRTTLQSMMKRLGIEVHEYRNKGNDAADRY